MNRASALLLALLASVIATLAAAPSGHAQTRVNVMPGYPNPPRVLPEQRRLARPGTPVCIWGNVNGGMGMTAPGATYEWSFSPNQNLQILDDGALSGPVTDDSFVCEVVTFQLLNNSTKETVTASLTVDGGPDGVAAKSVQILVVDPADPASDEALEAQAIDVSIAIDRGLRHLYRTRVYVPAGATLPAQAYWTANDANWNPAATAFALWAFQNQGHLPVAENFDGDIYAEWVEAGLAYLLNRVDVQTGAAVLAAPRAATSLGATADGVSDLNGNALVAQLDTSGHRGYVHPIVAAAFIATGTPDRVVTVGEASGATLRTLVEDAIDWVGANQNVGGAATSSSTWSGRGGWDYAPASSSTRSDMSINSWAYILMEGAEGVFGIDVPDWIKLECEYGLVYHQAATGMFGYTSTGANADGFPTTGGGLSGLALVETIGPHAQPGQVIAALGSEALNTIEEKRAATLGYVSAVWGNFATPSVQPWGGNNHGNYYSMWTMARSLRMTAKALGLAEDAVVPLTHTGQTFDWETGEIFETGVVSAAGSFTEGYFSWLVRNQELGSVTGLDYGRWNGWLGRSLSTAMGVLVLTPRVFVDTCPTIVNIPISGLNPPSGATVDPGVSIALSGKVVQQGPDRPILGVLVNGAPVASLDASGHFFDTITPLEGENAYLIRAIDSCGSSDTLHVLSGGEPVLDFSGYSDVSLQVELRYTNTSFNQKEKVLLVTAQARNQGLTPLNLPLVLVLDAFTQPGVTLKNPDGLTDLGRPYIAFTAAGPSLAPGASTEEKLLLFSNPQMLPVVFTQHWLAASNEAPFYVSAPPVLAAVDAPYVYAPKVVDPDGDALTHLLLAGPVGMDVAPDTGAVTWSPNALDLGVHAVHLAVHDGRGGFAGQSYSLEVVTEIANHPPLFTSAPPVQASVGGAYAYDATAVDPDDDPLLFGLVEGPAGMTVSPDGRVEWGFVLVGTFPVRLRVSDDRGAFADQAFVLSAGQPSGNPGSPVIYGAPAAFAVVGVPYLYQPVPGLLDPGETPSWTLIAGPAGMSVHPSTGLVTWTPGAAQLGVQPVQIELSDGAGGAAGQAWNVDVLLDAPNSAPVITSFPDLVTDVLQPYTYAVTAEDPDQDIVQYALVSPPAGMTIDATTGALAWTPDTLGTYLVAIQASDPHGATGSQVYSLEVLPPNHAPQITSAPVTAAIAGAPWYYDVDADDLDGDDLEFALLTAPTGAAIDALSGALAWTPAAVHAGPNPFLVEVSDGRGGSDQQAFSVDVALDTKAPLIDLLVIPDPAAVGHAMQVCVLAGDDVGVVHRTLAIDDVPVALDSLFCAIHVPADTTPITLKATAEDASGNVGTFSTTIDVIDPTAGAPEVEIVSPAQNVVVTSPVDVIATISSPQSSVSWELRLRNLRTGESRVLASGNGNVTAAKIGAIDPTLLPNDGYLAELVVDDGAYVSQEPLPLSVAGEFKLGNFSMHQVDVSLPVAGLPITLSRRYDSLDTTPGDFGAGWRLALNAEVSDTADESGLVAFGGFTASTRVYVTRPDGKRVGFSFSPKPLGFPFNFAFTPAFTPDDGVEGSLDVLGGDVLVYSGGVFFSGFGLSGPFNPSLYRFRNKQGVTFEIDELGGLQFIEDANGNTLTVTPAGILSSTGAAVLFDRDPAGRIGRIVLPGGVGEPAPELLYGYDPIGNLVQFVDAEGHATDYRYEEPAFPHHLTGIDDPLDRPVLKNVYDDDGRLVAQCEGAYDPDTLDGCWQFDLDPGSSVQTVFDGNGNRIELVVDAGGYVTTERRFDGLGGFQERHTSWDGAGNRLTDTDPAGNTWTWTYDDRGNVTLQVDPGGRATSYAYADDLMIQRTDASGGVTEYQYDESRNLRFVRDALGRATEYQYGPHGEMTRLIDAIGNEWAFTYSAFGIPDAITFPDLTTESYGYTPGGLMQWRIDRAGRRIDFEWNKVGRLVRETWDDGHVIEYEHNAAGQLTRAVDSHAEIVIDHWNTGDVRSVTTAGLPGLPPLVVRYGHDDGLGLVPGYDLNGNLTHVDLAGRAHTEYGYDAFNRLVAARQVAPMTASAPPTSRASGALTKIPLHPTPTAPRSLVAGDLQVDLSWNLAGRLAGLSRTVVGSGVTVDTAIAYDCSGCPEDVRSIVHTFGGGGHAITYARDALDRVVQRTDQEGVHDYALDGLGRILAADHPATSPTPDEHYAYDGVGNRTASHLSAAYQYAYSSGGGDQLLLTDRYAFEYDPVGNVTRRTDLTTGDRWEFAYDHRDRLVSETEYDLTDLQKHAIQHTYDPADQRVRTVVDGVAMVTVFDRRNPALILDGTGALVARRLYGLEADEVFAEVRGGAVRWLLADSIGSITDVVDGGGNLLHHYVYDSFGGALGGTLGERGELTFHGRPFDPLSGIGDYRARAYDPAIGRFLSADPLYPYQYVFAENNPLRFDDPTGRTALIGYACLAADAISKACSIYSYVKPVGDLWDTIAKMFDEVVDGPAAVKKFLEDFGNAVITDLPFAIPFAPSTDCGGLAIGVGAQSAAKLATGQPLKSLIPCGDLFLK